MILSRQAPVSLLLIGIALILPRPGNGADTPLRITLDKLQELVERSFDVQSGKSQVIEDRAQITRAYDPYVPDISFNAQRFVSSESYRDNRSPVYLNAAVSLFDKGRDIFGIQQAESNLRISELSLEAERQEASIRALELYFRILEAKSNIRVLQDLKSELDSVSQKARALVTARAMARLQLTRLEVEATLTENQLEFTRANLIGLRNQFSALFQIPPEQSWDIPPPPEFSVPGGYTRVTDSDLSKAAASWQRSLALSEKSSNLDGPTRWLAYSDQLPKVDLRASMGRPDFNSIQNEVSVRANLEIPIPLFDVPIMLNPINSIVAQKVRQNEIERARILADLKASIEARTASLNAALTQLKKFEEPLQTIKENRSLERQEILVAGGQAFNYLQYIMQYRNLELARNSARRVRDTEYQVLRILRGDDRDQSSPGARGNSPRKR